LDGIRAEIDSIKPDGSLAFPYETNLDDFLFKLGIRLNPDLLLDLNCGAIPMVVGIVGDKPETKLVPWRFYPVLNEFGNDLGRFLSAFCEAPQKFSKALWFRPAVSFFNPSLCDIPYFIQKLEDKANLAPLRQFLGMPDFQLRHERIGTTAPLQKSAYTDEIFRRVGEIYAADVQAFGYQDTKIAQLKY
jgi:hypothetical protein